MQYALTYFTMYCSELKRLVLNHTECWFTRNRLIVYSFFSYLHSFFG